MTDQLPPISVGLMGTVSLISRESRGIGLIGLGRVHHRYHSLWTVQVGQEDRCGWSHHV